MKNTFIYKSIIALAIMLAVIVACTEKTAEIRLDPKLTTSEVLEITSSQATVVAFVVAEGSGFIERGICYDKETEPTFHDGRAIFEGDIEGATFSIIITGLDFATKYYARAYAVSDNGTAYGDEITFTTLPVVPTVTTADITEVSYTTATGGGEVTATGGADVTARGLCYAITPNPTIENSTTSDGDGLGAFTSSLTNLDDGTEYFVRAYATSSAGTGYGPEVSFITSVPLNRTWNIPGDYVEASYPGSGLLNWSPENSPQVKSGLSAPDNLEGYVYMANTANHWKFATQPNWDGPNYGDGGSGILSETGDNFESPAGYYFLQADAKNLTYSAVATVWGVIGEATPLGWTDETALTYKPELMKWTGGIHLIVSEFKFRANHSWDYNYGSDAADGNLQAGGANIPIATEGDYAITLDLSTPLEYTYRVDMWGIIGSATPGEWVSDTDMTWDPVGEVFTVTLDLVDGEMKFRANDDWGYNLGGVPGSLEIDGGNIAVTAGNYTITLDPWNFVATITMN